MLCCCRSSFSKAPNLYIIYIYTYSISIYSPPIRQSSFHYLIINYSENRLVRYDMSRNDLTAAIRAGENACDRVVRLCIDARLVYRIHSAIIINNIFFKKYFFKCFLSFVFNFLYILAQYAIQTIFCNRLVDKCVYHVLTYHVYL